MVQRRVDWTVFMGLWSFSACHRLHILLIWGDQNTILSKVQKVSTINKLLPCLEAPANGMMRTKLYCRKHLPPPLWWVEATVQNIFTLCLSIQTCAYSYKTVQCFGIKQFKSKPTRREVKEGICTALQTLNKPLWTTCYICMHQNPKHFSLLL